MIQLCGAHPWGRFAQLNADVWGRWLNPFADRPAGVRSAGYFPASPAAFDPRWKMKWRRWISDGSG